MTQFRQGLRFDLADALARDTEFLANLFQGSRLAIDQAKDLATEGVSKVSEAVKDRRSGTDGPGLSVAPPPEYGS